MAGFRNAFDPDAGIVTIPIRADVAVRIHGIPSDFTAVEAEKVARVLRAYAGLPVGLPEDAAKGRA